VASSPSDARAPPPSKDIFLEEGNFGGCRNFGKPKIFFVAYFRSMNLNIFSINLYSLLSSYSEISEGAFS
jgi:hypothetical protein